MITFACFSPHPPILLPNVGSKEDREKVKKTLKALDSLAKEFEKSKSNSIIISSPHPDWGFNVPLFFLAKDFKGEIKAYLTEQDSPENHFNRGKEFFKKLEKNKKYAIIGSGDLSHCLKNDGPYGFHPDGPKFDNHLIDYLKNKDIKNFLKLDKTYPEAGECGLRSFSFVLGILEESQLRWQPKILSYESPFGVGYLVVKFELSK